MNENSRYAIIEALRFGAIVHDQHNGNNWQYITHECNYPFNISLIEKLVSTMLRSTEDLFPVKYATGSKFNDLDSTKLGNQILRAVNHSLYREIKHHFPIHRFHPYYDLFVGHLINKQLNTYNLRQNDIEKIKWCVLLNEFVDEIRKTVNSAAFKMKLQNYQRSINKNSRGLRKYFNALFQHHPSLLGIRLDLFYRKWQDWPDGIDTNPVMYADVKAHWTTLLKFMKLKLTANCLRGYAWKLENSLAKSYNYHLIIFVDIDIGCQHVDIARIIGDYWRTTATHSNGRYFSHNGQNTIKSAGTGVLNRDGAAWHENLNKVVLYMTETDHFIRLVLPGNDRTFGKGNMPKPIATNPAKAKIRNEPVSSKRS